jgi:hypothetical protein
VLEIADSWRGEVETTSALVRIQPESPTQVQAVGASSVIASRASCLISWDNRSKREYLR